MADTVLETRHDGDDFLFAEFHEVFDPASQLIEVPDGNLCPDDNVVLVLDIAKDLCQGLPIDFPVAFYRRPPDRVSAGLGARRYLARECYFKLPGLGGDAFGLLE